MIRGRLGALGGERAELEERLRAAAERIPSLDEALSAARAALDDGRRRARRRAAPGLAALGDGGKTAADCEREARVALDAGAARPGAAARSAERRPCTQRSARAPRTDSGAADRLRVVLESLNGDRPATPPRCWPTSVERRPRCAPALGRGARRADEAVIVDSPQFALQADRDSEGAPRRPLEFHAGTRTRLDPHPAIAAPGIAGRLIDMLGVDPRFRARGGSDAWPCDARRRFALGAGGVESERSRHALRHPRGRRGVAGKNHRRRQQSRSRATTTERRRPTLVARRDAQRIVDAGRGRASRR